MLSESESVNWLLRRARAQVTVTVTVLVVRQPECLNMMPLELELITVQWSAWVQGHKVTAPRQHRDGRCAAEPAGGHWQNSCWRMVTVDHWHAAQLMLAVTDDGRPRARAGGPTEEPRG